jgi:hypothetical protein
MGQIIMHDFCAQKKTTQTVEAKILSRRFEIINFEISLPVPEAARYRKMCPAGTFDNGANKIPCWENPSLSSQQI